MTGNAFVTRLRATRPGFLSVTLVTCLLGFASAAADGVAIPLGLALLGGLGALLAHAGANVINDVHDDLNGSDAANRERVAPFTGGSRFIQDGILSRQEMQRLALGLFAATAVIGLALIAATGPAIALFGVVGLALAWTYSAPPLQLMSRGLGELALAAGWLLIVVGIDFLCRQTLAARPLWAGGGLALLAAAILFVNQFPDRRADQGAGKRNWVVRLGPPAAARLYPLLAAGGYLPCVVGVAVGALPAATLLALAGAPWSWRAARILRDNAEQPARLAGAIRATLAAAHLHGLLLAADLVLGR